ncbi:MAG: hypothetical protein QME71_04650 [Dehalococcoidia bacterium]|nr:hypothetical protein [Dehalococcoidia bacterium]
MSHQCRVLNGDGELIASGVGDVSEERPEITFRPAIDTYLIDKTSAPLFMELDDGRRLELERKYMRFRLYDADGERREIYRFRYVVGEQPHSIASGQ